MRYPDGSRRVMTRRAWWLLALNFLLPGSAQAAAGSRRLARIGLGATLLMWVLLVVALLFALLWPIAGFSILTGAWLPDWLALLRPVLLYLLQAVLVAYAVLWVVLTIDTLRMVRIVKMAPIMRVVVVVAAIVSMFVSGSSAVWAANVTGSTRSAISDIFASTGTVVDPVDGYYNILLLGADSGQGRDSMRFDSISVVSVNAETGAVTIFGIPRDLPNAPFPEDSPMYALYPDGLEGYSSSTCGWTSAINQLTNVVEVCRSDGGTSLYPDAEADSSTPAIEATKDAAEGVLGIQIPYYVFIDMDGFAQLVDALGGVDINVTERLPEGWGPTYSGEPAEDWAIGWIEVGQQHMDGDTAQWYARSRYTTSDWDRMLRQRQLQEAILAQFTPENVLVHFNEVAAAGTNLLETDVPQGLLPTLMDLAIKAKTQTVTTVELTPTSAGGIGVDDEDPDYEWIHDYVQNTLHPATASPSS
ncbi:MAG: LCP family protein [Microbacterium sp.]